MFVCFLLILFFCFFVVVFCLFVCCCFFVFFVFFFVFVLFFWGGVFFVFFVFLFLFCVVVCFLLFFIWFCFVFFAIIMILILSNVSMLANFITCSVFFVSTGNPFDVYLSQFYPMQPSDIQWTLPNYSLQKSIYNFSGVWISSFSLFTIDKFLFNAVCTMIRRRNTRIYIS